MVMNIPAIKTRPATVGSLYSGYAAHYDTPDETALITGYGRTEEQAINDLILQIGRVRKGGRP